MMMRFVHHSETVRFFIAPRENGLARAARQAPVRGYTEYIDADDRSAVRLNAAWPVQVLNQFLLNSAEWKRSF